MCRHNDAIHCNSSSSSAGRRCVPRRYVCDGDLDCPEGDDESGSECEAAAANKCAAEGPGRVFIEEESRCLAVSEACARGYHNGTVCDEYCEQRGYDYKCKRGDGPSCIRKDWLCDGEVDCPHGEDEDREMCKALCSTGGSTYCEAEKRCRVLGELCEPRSVAKTECDTAVCEAFCQSHGFSCPGNATACIPEEWKCDGERDCSGGEDEAECGGDA